MIYHCPCPFLTNKKAARAVVQLRLGVVNPTTRSTTAEYLSPRKLIPGVASLISRTVFAGRAQSNQHIMPFIGDIDP